MRLLHTSDWHLGRSFGAFSLLDDQRAALARIAELVRSESVELVVVAGDVFDRAIPSAEAVTALRDGLQAIRHAGAMVALISGNHDSAERLAAFDGLLAEGVYVAGGYRSAGTIARLRAADGPLALVLVPFLDPMLAPADEQAPGDGDGQPSRPTHASVLRRRLERARELVAGERSVVVAHAFVRGGWPSDSERELGVGGSDMAPAEVFAGFSYVALGHLHRAQDLGASTTVHYCGTPLAYSFSESAGKTVSLVDIAPGGAVRVERIALGVCRGVATVRGSLDELLTDPAHEQHTGRWIRAQLTDTGVLTEPMARLRERFPYVVELHRVPAGGAGEHVSVPASPGQAMRTPLRTTLDFWSAVHGEPATPAIEAHLRRALEQAASVP